MRYAKCEECNKDGYTGWMACAKKWLCAKCAAKKLRVDEGKVQAILTSSVFLPSEIKSKEGGKK